MGNKYLGDGLSVNHTTFKLLAQVESSGPWFRMKNPADLQRLVTI